MFIIHRDMLELSTGIHHRNYVSDNETIGSKELPESFEVPGLGNGMPFYPTKIRFNGQKVTYKQLHGCVGVTLWRM
jgi:hypothetical protein